VINGSIVGSNSWSGGLVGQIHKGEVSNSYYHGEYSFGGSWTGGLVGRVQDANGMISNTFVSASGFGTNHAHYAVVGMSDGNPLKNIYWNNLGTLNSNMDTDKNSDDITEIDNNESYFYNPINEPMASWDASIWEFSENSLPMLRVQNNESIESDTTPPNAPTLTTTPPLSTTANSIDIEVNGEAESHIYVNHEEVTILGLDGRAFITLNLIYEGENHFDITLRDNSGNESEVFGFTITKELSNDGGNSDSIDDGLSNPSIGGNPDDGGMGEF